MVRDVTDPIERAISGADGLETVQSTSSEGNTAVFATFKYGTDMAAAEAFIENALNGVNFPAAVDDPTVGRFDPDAFPVIQFGVVSDRPLVEVQALVQDLIIPEIEDIEGVTQVQLVGDVDRNFIVTADLEKMSANGISLFQVSSALRDNNVTLPAGLLFDGTQAVIAKTTHSLESVEDLRNLVVGVNEDGPVRLSDVADVTFGAGRTSSISRTNGKPGLSVSVSKEPESNTVDVTNGVNDVIANLDGIPDDVDVIVVTDQGPEIQGQIDNLVREGTFGFLFAVSVVFAFMLTIRPTVVRGFFNTLRPTVVIGLSIPLSVFTGILLMNWQDMTLNFMTLGGLAISVGRVVDDSIVVLENVYRHIQGGRERWRAALEATREVGPAIFASTMTTVVVFVPLAFIQGLVGSFFLPFALTVSFALIASLLVALTAVPVLGAFLLRPGDLPEGAGDEGDLPQQDTWLQRTYLTVLKWALGHRVVTLLAAAVITVGSLGLMATIPVNLFGGDGDRFLQIQLSLPPGSSVEQTVEAVTEIETRVDELSDVYTVIIGGGDFTGPGEAGGPMGLQQASFFIRLSGDAPEGIAETLRDEFEKPGRTLRISEIADGPPAGGVEIFVTGPNYNHISDVTEELAASIGAIEGIVNLESDVAEARPEVAIEVDPEKAGSIGLTTRQVGLQISQYTIGQRVTSINVDGEAVDVVLTGDPRSTGSVDQLGSLVIVGPGGAAPLGDLAEPVLREGPVSISRTDGRTVGQHHCGYRLGRHAGGGSPGGRKDCGAGLAAGSRRQQRRHLRGHCRRLPGHIHRDGRRHHPCIPRHGGGLGEPAEPVGHHPDAAPGPGWRDGSAYGDGPGPRPGGHDGRPAAYRNRGYQRDRAHLLCRAATCQGPDSLRCPYLRGSGAAAAHPDDCHNHQLCAFAAGSGNGGRRRPNQRGAGHRGYRRSDQLHGSRCWCCQSSTCSSTTASQGC